jgi:WD40 repeat protein
MTIKPVTSAPNTQFDLSNIGTFPQEILHNIFSNIVNSKDIHSLWSTCHHFRWAISEWTPFWTTLLESHFPGSYTPSPGIKPIDVYNDCLELENTVRSGVCKHYILSSNSDVQCIIKHGEELIAATVVNIEIWKGTQLQKRFPLQKQYNNEVIVAMVAYKEKLFVTSSCWGAVFMNGIPVPDPDDSTNVYDLNSGNVLRKLEGHHGEVFAHCKIENKLYFGSDDGTIKIWDMDTLEFMGTLEENSENKPGVTSLLPHKNTLYSGNTRGEIRAWDLNTHKSDIFDRHITDMGVTEMLIHGNKFISIFSSLESKNVISVMNFISKQSLYPDLKSNLSKLFGFGRLLFFVRDGGRSVIALDLNTGKKLMEHMFIDYQETGDANWTPSSSLVFSEGKLYVISDKWLIHVFDFAEPIKHKKRLERLTKVDGRLRTLQIAIARENINEIIACVDTLIATDPKNKEFCEFLCQITQGEDIPTYEFLFNRAFDYREILRTASFYHIKTAADKFTEKLKTDRNVVVSTIPFSQFRQIIDNEVSSESESED